ncbi:hypothetical protein [Desulfitobacterium sp. LBE]|uniref:hypothetical protein n=1 Tax=Desulfitobacterium sp. LBE TaxID=884086 RepID=UPI001FAAAD2F|nr:hypothetical protein [Desulfitobacterium sp. LBE]
MRISWVAFKAFPKVADLAAPSGVGKDGKSDLSRESGDLLHLSRNALPAQTPKTAQGFCFTVGSEFKRAETKLREKHTAEKGWKQDVSNPPLSRSDLAGHLSERRALRVSFVRAAYGATGVNQNPGDSAGESALEFS